MKNRLSQCFFELRQQQRKALISFITAGDPSPQLTVSLLHDLVSAGANILELGVPFSDPAAEGPIIQAACERALKQGVSLSQVLSLVAEFRQSDDKTPLVLMGYLNPIEVIGYANFAKLAAQAGVDGIIVVDLPIEESAKLSVECKKNQLDLIYLLAPTSPLERVKKISCATRGFLYYVSSKAVTGMPGELEMSAIAEKVTSIRQYTTLPVVVGFGISDADTAAAVSSIADGVVVGSALVKCLAAIDSKFPAKISLAEGRMQVKQLIAELRLAIDKNKSDYKS